MIPPRLGLVQRLFEFDQAGKRLLDLFRLTASPVESPAHSLHFVLKPVTLLFECCSLFAPQSRGEVGIHVRRQMFCLIFQFPRSLLQIHRRGTIERLLIPAPLLPTVLILLSFFVAPRKPFLNLLGGRRWGAPFRTRRSRRFDHGFTEPVTARDFPSIGFFVRLTLTERRVPLVPATFLLFLHRLPSCRCQLLVPGVRKSLCRNAACDLRAVALTLANLFGELEERATFQQSLKQGPVSGSLGELLLPLLPAGLPNFQTGLGVFRVLCFDASQRSDIEKTFDGLVALHDCSVVGGVRSQSLLAFGAPLLALVSGRSMHTLPFRVSYRRLPDGSEMAGIDAFCRIESRLIQSLGLGLEFGERTAT